MPDLVLLDVMMPEMNGYEVCAAQRGELRQRNAGLEARVAEQVGQIERLARLKRFLTPKVAELIVSGEIGDPLKTHRCEVTVMCIDLRGFTVFTETAEPEQVMRVLREYHAALGEIITAHDGTIVVEAVGELTRKGLSRSIAVFNVMAARKARTASRCRHDRH